MFNRFITSLSLIVGLIVFANPDNIGSCGKDQDVENQTVALVGYRADTPREGSSGGAAARPQSSIKLLTGFLENHSSVGRQRTLAACST
jgi:hypothetical protein